MNKIKWIVCLLSVALILTGCTSGNGSEMEASQLLAERSMLAEKAEDLTGVSDLIIVFIPEKQENVMHYTKCCHWAVWHNVHVAGGAHICTPGGHCAVYPA